MTRQDWNKLNGRRQASHSHSTWVPCEHAKKRGHQVTIVVANDDTILHVGSPCRKDASNDAIRRLGGQLCYQKVWLLKQLLRGRKRVENGTFGPTSYLTPLYQPMSRALSKVNGPRAETTEQPAAHTPTQELRLQLLSKWASMRAGLAMGVDYLMDVDTRRPANLRRLCMARSNFVIAREEATGRWVMDEQRVFDHASSVHFSGITCPLCPGMKLSTRGRQNHFRGEQHKQNFTTLMRRVVRFMNLLGKPR